MVTLLYGIAIGIVLTVPDLISICVGSIIVGVCIAFAYYETRVMRSVRKFEKETSELDKVLRKTWQNIEDDMQRRSRSGVSPIIIDNNEVSVKGGFRHPKELSIEQKMLIAIENQDFEEAARLRDKQKEK